MRDENRNLRQAQIEQAAYEVLAKRGYAGASMLNIAKHAKASNETLYNWYGDKLGLFRSLVVRNASEIRELLEQKLTDRVSPLDALQTIGPELLSLLVGERAIALNRAAAADPSGELGMAITEAGRETVAPLIGRLLENARDKGALKFDSPQEALGLYLSLLVGDLQIRRAIGAIPKPTSEAILQRADSAFAQLKILLS